MHRTGATGDGWRLPAKQLDGAVMDALSAFLRDEIRIVDALQLADADPDRLRAALHRAAAAADKLDDRQLLRRLLHRVTIGPDSICLAIRRRALQSTICGTDGGGLDHPDESVEITVPVLLKRRGVEAKLVLGAAEGKPHFPDHHLIALLARAHHWHDQLCTGKTGSINEISERDGIHASDVGRLLQLAFLAPDIVDVILAGCQPIELTARRLKRIGPLPLEWDRQRQLLGFPA